MTRSELGLAWQADKPPGRYGELAATAEATLLAGYLTYACWPLAALAHMTQGEAEQDRDDQHRQQISLGDRADQVRRNHLHQEIDDRQRFRVRHVAGDRLLIQ